MASDAEINAAADAIIDSQTSGLRMPSPNTMAKAALDAAERIRERDRVANCKHTNRQGAINGGPIRWWCRDCHKSWSEPPEEAARPAPAADGG